MKAIKVVALLGAVAVSIGFSGGAFAQTATSNITVNANVQQKCKIDAATITFANYDPVVTHAAAGVDLDATATLGVTCTKGSSSITVELNTGTNYSAPNRRMFDAVANDYLNYQIYQPSGGTAGDACAYTTIWGSTAGGYGSTLPVSPSGAWSASTAQNFNLCGRVPRGQDVSAGTAYTSTVVATVNF